MAVILFCVFMLSLQLAFAESADVESAEDEIPLSDDVYLYRSMDLTLNTEVDVSLVAEGANPKVDWLKGSLSWRPMDYGLQTVLDISVQSDDITSYDLRDDSILMVWENPGVGDLQAFVVSKTRNRNAFVEITEPPEFPIGTLPYELKEFTLPAEIIDINDEIRKQAEDLVKDETDQFSAVFRIAEWVSNNVEYNLNTVTAEASKQASWVFENRNGVCDEITSLFISMLRSIGIPAKFVSGIAYTNIEGIYEIEWGPHGWAEVYFPDIGWVPYDVTYEELGFLDASHIKLQESYDSSQKSMNFSSLGRDVGLKLQPVQNTVHVTDNTIKIKPEIEIEAEYLYDKVGHGSANLLEIKLKNIKNHYSTAKIYVSRTESTSSQEPYEFFVMLKPGEEKSVFMIIESQGDFSRNERITFFTSIASNRGASAKTSFISEYGYQVTTRSQLKELIPSSNTVLPFKTVRMLCEAPKKVEIGEEYLVSCDIENIDFRDANLQFCVFGDCEPLRLSAESKIEKTYSAVFDEPELVTGVVKIGDSTRENRQYLFVEVFDLPSVEISDVVYPKEMRYDDKEDISFLVVPKSANPPKNIRVVLSSKYLENEWNYPEIDGPTRVVLNIPGSRLDFVNTFELLVEFEDEEGNKYSNSENITIRLKELSFMQKVKIYVARFGNWFDKKFL